jgi:hypothetical protein
MKNYYIVRHQWENESKSDKVHLFISKMIREENAGLFPFGYRLLGVIVSKKKLRAYCLWEADTKIELERFIESQGPVSSLSIKEFDGKFSIDEPKTDLIRLL